MAPRQSKKAQIQVQESESEEEQQSSYDQGGEDLVAKAQALMEAGKARRDAKRQAMQQEYGKKSKDIAIRINNLFEMRKNRVTKSQKVQWDRLDTLNRRRTSLEAQILASMRSIEHHTANMTSELLAMLEGRMEDVQGEEKV